MQCKEQNIVWCHVMCAWYPSSICNKTYGCKVGRLSMPMRWNGSHQGRMPCAHGPSNVGLPWPPQFMGSIHHDRHVTKIGLDRGKHFGWFLYGCFHFDDGLCKRYAPLWECSTHRHDSLREEVESGARSTNKPNPARGGLKTGC